jgi:hypothetical protein
MKFEAKWNQCSCINLPFLLITMNNHLLKTMWRLIAIALGVLVLVSQNLKAEDARDIDFFEKKIRPALIENCIKCHSEADKKVKGGLALDSKEGVAKGGETGPAVVPGKPELSLLVKVILYDGDMKMPPKGKLAPEVIADLTQWVKMGAPDPRTKKVADVTKDEKKGLKGQNWWSFAPITNAKVPFVKNNLVRNEIDNFILARLEKDNLVPSSEASKAILVRRLYFDLTGLPPTPEQVKTFLSDNSADAYEKLVDNLLKSPHFGEKWGRHWLDIARFSESSGGGRTALFPDSWRYRDYVIQAFNSDKPFNRFLLEQIAGDLLPAKDNREQADNIIATSFLALGPTNFERQDKKVLEMDVIDEQLDTLGKAVLGMTIGCARCHDHKFDPIPTHDYYALAGIFKSTKTLIHDNVSRWIDRKLPVDAETEKKISEHDAKVALLDNKIKELKKTTTKVDSGKKIIDPKELDGIVIDDSKAKKVGEWTVSKFSNFFIGTGYLHDDNKNKGELTLSFTPEFPKAGKYEVLLAYQAGSTRANDVPITIFHGDGETVVHVNMQKNPPIDGRFVSLGQFRFENSGQNFVLISNMDTKGHVTVDALQFLPVGEAEKVVKPSAKGETVDAKELKKMESELKELKVKGPVRPVAMSVEEEKKPAGINICIRGNIHTPGALVPRGFLSAVKVNTALKIPDNASGRKEFGLWLGDDSNPLTARVYANRVWSWLLGSGLVRTTDNFGTTGEAPSHPELLDFLAKEFIKDNWSTKKLVRKIVTSHTYRQTSEESTLAQQKDPENKSFSHMNRKRLEVESIRDAILMVSGKLDMAMGGSTINPGTSTEYGYKFTDYRRSVYTPIFRNNLPEIFEVFDFPDPNLVVGKRNVSTIAPQALYLMNNPFIIEKSGEAALHLLKENKLSETQKIESVYFQVLGRAPTPAEQSKVLLFLQEKSEKEKAQAWPLVFQAMFSTLDFRYLH